MYMTVPGHRLLCPGNFFGEGGTTSPRYVVDPSKRSTERKTCSF